MTNRQENNGAGQGQSHPEQGQPLGMVIEGSVANGVEVRQIGRASCRERVEISVVAVTLKKKPTLRHSATCEQMHIVTSVTSC